MPERAPTPASDTLTTLRRALAERDAQALVLRARAAAAEAQLDAEQARVRMLREQFDEALHALDAAKREATLLELACTAAPGRIDTARPTFRAMQGLRIVHLGGRPASTAALERLVRSAGGTLLPYEIEAEIDAGGDAGVDAAIGPGIDAIGYGSDTRSASTGEAGSESRNEVGPHAGIKEGRAGEAGRAAHSSRFDGAMAARRGHRLASAVAGADLVVYVAAHVTADTVHLLERLCRAHAVPLQRIRHASLAGAVDAIVRQAASATRLARQAPGAMPD